MTTEIDGNQLLNSGAYERVEVVRGTSALQGSVGDPSATVNLVRKRPTKEQQAEISVGIGRWRRWTAEADVSGPLNPSGSLRGRAVVNAEGGRHWTEGSRDRSDMVYGIAEYDFSPQTTAYAGINHQRAREKEFYGGDLPVYDSAGYPTRFGIRDNNKIKGAGIGNARRNSLPDWNTALKTTGKPSWNTATTVRKPSIPVWVTPHTAISGTTTARPEPIFIKWPTISSAMPSASSSTGNTIYGGANTKPYSASEATARGTNAPGQTKKATIP